MSEKMKKILVTGANGQIGTELVQALYQRYGKENVISSDVREVDNGNDGPFEIIDVLNKARIDEIVKKYNVDSIFHMAAILSAVGEKNPQLCWTININGLYNILEVARENKLLRVYCPSSMAAFGPTTPRVDTPQETVLEPNTMYGLTKVAGELLNNYYFEKFGLDIRGIRYPGIISNKALPGGGTTDYAVDIYYQAVKTGHFECFVSKDTKLPMMYMPDCIRATIELMEADLSKLKHHSNYNLAAISFTAEELYESVKKYIPELTVEYKPDFRQKIANSWPQSIDDTTAREEWGWKHEFDLDKMTVDMLKAIRAKKDRGEI